MATKTKQRAVASAPLAPGSARIRDALGEQQLRLATAIRSLEAAGVEDIHGGRVAARRLRSLLKTFRPLLDARRTGSYRADLRSFARSLGAVREADVRRELLLALARGNGSITPAQRRQLGVLLEDLRIAARENLRRHLAEPGWARLRGALERHRTGAALLVVRDAEMADVLALVARAWRRPVRLLRRHPEDTAELHELRLAFKHCRYALESVADLAPKATARLLRRLRAAQDRIGEHRDTLLADHWVRLNERTLGRALSARLLADLARQEQVLRRQSATLAGRVLQAWQGWRDATRSLRKGASRDRR
jgi:CHAD domain-containing protein